MFEEAIFIKGALVFLVSEDSYREVVIYCYAFESLSNILATYRFQNLKSTNTFLKVQ